MSEEGSRAKFVPGLGEALFRGEPERTAELLAGLRVGEVIKTWGLVLLVDSPTQEEVALMERSRKEEVEYAVVRVGDEVRELKGERAEVDERECVRIAESFSAFPGIRTFTHTHWDRETTPIPSGPDAVVFQLLIERWGYRCRVVSWLPGKKTFEYMGRYVVGQVR